ncbi:hypothetical protein INS49_003848 [Diaporthe citri]|uniref:uncharacterized protein n=1 Tax=Diaporthe citri TaxID=83186 RepID=UPI001C80391F|nr:uncharacterized protein INS49_003848 [Diaporthe citri]KAG6354767.1 hypothetical protein INS49_003848 [Diaporthe citri]
MEVLGAAAAVSQFLIQLIATVGLAKKLKGSSKSLKQYQERLNSLKDLCEDIRSNPALRTEEVRKETQSILHIIDTHKNASILSKKGRFRRAIAFIINEQSFRDLFATLEDKKTTLSLHVLSINCTALHDINLLIASMGPIPDSHNELTPPHSPTPSEMSYLNCQAGDNVDQHNGPTVRGVMLTPTYQVEGTKMEYRGSKKTKRGDQIAGLTWELPPQPNPRVDFIPVVSAVWEGLKHEGVANAQRPGARAGEQLLGTVITVKKDSQQRRNSRQ